MKKFLLLFVSLLAVFGLGACDVFDNPEDILDCIEDPSGPDCDPNILLADTVIANWDGSMEHVELVMDNMDFSESMTQTITFDAIIDDGYTTVNINLEMVDSYVFGEMNKMHRQMTQTMLIDGEEIVVSSEVLYVEVETGVHVYVNIADIRQLLADEMQTEVLDAMDAVGLTEDWVQFKFDDTLANVIEIEVLKEMLKEVFWKEVGANFFYDLQDEVELELGFDFGSYGVDLGLFVEYILDEDFVQAEALLDAVDFNTMLTDFDVVVVADVVSNWLVENQVAVELALPGYDFSGQLVVLETTGFVAWFNQLTVEEQDYFMMEVEDFDALEVFLHHQNGDLAHFIVMEILLDPESDLSEMDGLDFDALVDAMDALDYEAFYAEEIMLSELFQAIFDGQDAFDVYVAGLGTTAPQTASILAPFSETVMYLEDVFAFVEDIELGFENLSMFAEYFTMEYYVQNNMAVLDVEATEDNNVLTTITLDNYGTLANDLFNDFYWYMDSFNSFEMPYVAPVNCPVGEECEVVPLDEIENGLNQLGPIEVGMLYNPASLDYMEIKIDLANVLVELFNSEGMDASDNPIEKLEITIKVEEGATVTIPTNVSVANEIAEDFAKFSLIMYVWDVMDDVEYDIMNEYDDMDLLVGTTTSLTDAMIQLSPAFDHDLSMITVSGTVMDPVVSIDLYWIDGTRVFTDVITKLELEEVVGNDSGAPSAAEYQMYLAKIDPANYSTTKLFLMYLLDEDMDNYEVDFGWDAEWIYADALAVEAAAQLYCAQTSCDSNQVLTWGDVSPYVEGIDTNYYDLYDSNIVVAELYDGSWYIHLEASGQGNLEFPDWISPSDADPSYVSEDWD